MATLTKANERRLRRLARPQDAGGYAAWLAANPQTDREDERTAEAQEERRREPGYGLAGEALYGSELGNDGYAAYLQAAAKEARAARAKARERETVAEGQRALAGYAAYLDGLRAEDADRLIAAGKTILSLSHDDDAGREAALTAATDDPRAAEALRALHGQGAEPDNKPDTHLTNVLNHIYTQGFRYQESYEYCRLLGYSDTRAKAIAAYATARLDPIHADIQDIFNH